MDRVKLVGKLIGIGFLLGFIVVSCTKESKVYFEVSEQTVTVHGYVKDVNGNPIEGAKVSIYPFDAEVKTDKNGLYRLSVKIESLPRDAILVANARIQVEKEGYVTSARNVPLAEYKEHATGITAVIQRLREENFILANPAKIKVQVIDKEGNPVPGSVVRVLPSPGIAFYLGIPQGEPITSVTSATSPVAITQGIPALLGEAVILVAFPPAGKESEFSINAVVSVDLGEEMDEVTIVLGVERFKILYTSVDSGQYISPNSDIKIIFSREITGVNAQVFCSGSPFLYQTYVKIEGAIAEIKPAGALLGQCTLEIYGAYGKYGEMFLPPVPVSYDFVAFDPSAPRGLACPKPEINLKAYSDKATAVVFSQHTFIFDRIFYLEPGNFSTPNINSSNLLELIWSPLVLAGIVGYKVYALDIAQAELGRVVWEDVGVIPQFRPADKKWTVSIPVPPWVDISWGKGASIAVVPVNINGEEVCSLENAPYLNFIDNLGPLIEWVFGFPPMDYSSSTRTFIISFSEEITSGQITLSSRTFNITPISQQIVGANRNQIWVEFFAEPITLKIPAGIADNDNTSADDNTLTFASAPSILWVGEVVDVYDANGNPTPNVVTAVVKEGNNWKVWFWNNLGTHNFQNGWIKPDAINNDLQSPQGGLYVSDVAKRELTTLVPGLAVGDRIEVANVGGGSLVLTIEEVMFDIINIAIIVRVKEDVPSLKCNNSNLTCAFRSLRPDIVFKAEGVRDTSENNVVEWADQTDSSGSIIW